MYINHSICVIIFQRMVKLLRPDESWKPNNGQKSLTYKMYEYSDDVLYNIRVNLCGDTNTRSNTPEQLRMMPWQKWQE